MTSSSFFRFLAPVGLLLVGCHSAQDPSANPRDVPRDASVEAGDDDGGVPTCTFADFPPGPLPAATVTYATSALCNAGGYCMQAPQPTTEIVPAIWSNGASDVWIAGHAGTLLRWNGATWSGTASVTGADLEGIDGTGDGNVWAVGLGGTIVHWDGTAWSVVPSATTADLYGLWLAKDATAWAVGADGAVVRYDGTAWTNASAGTNMHLNDVWGSAPDDVWAVGWAGAADDGSGVIEHWNGSAWSETDAPAKLSAVYGFASDDVWVAGDLGLMHWDGHAWSGTASGAAGCALLYALWGTGTNNLYAAGKYNVLHYDGASWSSVTSALPTIVFALAPDGQGGLWAVGESADANAYGPGLVRGSGTSWVDYAPATSLPSASISGVAADDVWAAGATATSFAHWDGSQWSFVASPTEYPTAVWAIATDDVWALSLGGLEHWDGHVWSTNDDPDGGATQADALGGSGANDVWTYSSIDSTWNHYDGASWTTIAGTSGDYIDWIWGSAPTNVWAVGGAVPDDGGPSQPVINHWEGTAWARETLTPPAGMTGAVLHAVWGTSATDVWAVGDAGIAMHFDGATWTRHDSPNEPFLYSIWGTGPNDVYAAGAANVPYLGEPGPGLYGNGLLVHWDGSAWSGPIATGTSQSIGTLWGTASGLWLGAGVSPGGESPTAALVWKQP